MTSPRPNTFAFVIHPPSVEHVRKAYPFTRLMPAAAIAALLARTPPFVAGRVRGVRSLTGAELTGYLVSCPLMPRQMLEAETETVVGRLLEASRIARRLGAGIMGLGGYTSIVGNKGQLVAARAPIAVTSGSAGTAWAACTGLLEMARRRGVDSRKATLAIIGATGSIGSLCSWNLATTVGRLVIAARRAGPLAELRESLKQGLGIEARVAADAHDAARDADLMIVTTSAPQSLLTVAELKRGAVVCDVSVPANIDVTDSNRADVVVFEGSRVKLPGSPKFGVDISTEPGVAYACMAETMLLTLEGRYESFSIGDRLDPAKVGQIDAMAKKHGFEVHLPAAG